MPEGNEDQSHNHEKHFDNESSIKCLDEISDEILEINFFQTINRNSLFETWTIII